MKIAVLVSGGVDSSLALARLVREGYDVTPFYLKIWLEDELSFLGSCPWEEDLSFVQSLCRKLGLKLRIANLQQAYQSEIVSYTIESVAAGRTPNPDILCNFRIKYGAFVREFGKDFDFIASGHYARVSHENDGSRLLMSADAIKDQTYFLAMLEQGQLSKTMFPIGDLTKAKVRELAEELQLPTAARPDSQGLCFLGKIKFSDFLKFHLGTKPGPIIEYESGRVLGQHDGFYYFTLGQRHGLRLSGGPWFVVAKDPKTNTVTISNKYFSIERTQVNFTGFRLLNENDQVCQPNVTVKLRHGPEFSNAKVSFTSQTTGTIILEKSDQGAAPGQFIVFYSNTNPRICLAIAEIC